MPWKDPTRAGGAPFGIGAAFHIRVRRARRSPCRFSVSGLEGHLEPRQDEIARRVVDAVSEVAELPREAVWVVFEDVAPSDWYVAGNAVADARK